MKTSTCDVLIVGAGPAGTSAARAAAASGARVVVIERRAMIGVPVQCAEYIPAVLLGEAGVGRHFVVQSVRGMRTFLNGRMIQETAAPGYIIRRELFDQALADAARKSGAAIWLSSRALSKDGDGVFIRRQISPQSDHFEEFHIRLNPTVIIGADGPHSRVGKWIGSINKNLIPAVQVRVRLTCPMDFIEVFFEDGIYGGYGWLFPKGGEANVGLGMKHRGGEAGGMKRTLDEFVSHLIKQGKIKGEPGKLTAGWIPAEAPRTIVRENILLAGDAAGHTHPITGAGVLRAVIGGRMAGKWAARAVGSRDIRLLAEYESEWSGHFGEMLEHGFQRRQLLEREWDRLEEIIKYCWVTFKEYHSDTKH